MTDSLPGCYLYLLDCLEYQTVWQWQRSLLKARLDNPALADVLLLVEHPPVYTLGTGSTLDHLKFDPAHSPAALHRTERGGEVTYHCPGQLVGYPIVNLCRHQPDLHWYLRQLEAVIIQTLAAFGVQGERVPGLTGVWVEGVKVAAIGIKVKRWITMHGFALNVCPDLAGFEQIVPCGIRDRAVGSLVQFVPEVTMAQVRAQVILAFEQIFHCRLLPQVGLPVV
ncbi:lipoyl(octanoyl) transferase LipB [Spirulina major CS-329]|uniref:lipoyl(octanoyl) transferase LipB n=1 Tax=Spirulina TaxID=1154 RepID=UPI00232FBA8F|nr:MULTISPECIES: lipoyl(octanoyl) transferase LipB [Spirulina]MDB9493656.1 lipoyl(octanoyl) transferase LipB [Spirulina subsalsa CS-330]MDB9505038.1 lipoyl(octanoyl) transferase LipB [Spirulina major CS-329]